jgi:tetratricopeptide (TPR) repeat protein
MARPGRNDACPCGSGLKYKRCCLGKVPAKGPQVPNGNPLQGNDPPGDEGFSEAIESGLSRAQNLVYDGWELFASDIAEANRCFKKAVSLDADLADAYNGLAEVAVAKGKLVVAERYYLTAYEKAKAFLGTEDKEAFAWWGELETRPYMRSRHGLGLLYLEVGRYDQAIALFKDLLYRNPNDNQGVRYLIAPAHLMNDDLAGALREYDWYKRHYREDIPDPHFLLNWGLASFMAERYEDAAVMFRSTLFANPYLLPLVLDMKPKVLPIWHSNNLMHLDYARDYFSWYGSLWSGRDDARRFVKFLWKDKEIGDGFRQWVDLWTELNDLDVSEARSSLIDEANRVEAKKPSPAFFGRMKEFLALPLRPS